MKSVLFVCLGNICRSPAGEGMLRKMAEEQRVDLNIDSCGLGDWHVGQLPDERMRDAAKRRGIALQMRARQVRHEDFDDFDCILGATEEIVEDLKLYAKTNEQKNKVKLMTAFSKKHKNEEIPDPYYKGAGDFELVLDMLEDACEGILSRS